MADGDDPSPGRHGEAHGRAPTLREVAARAGVSIKTVSNVVNSHPGVRPATRARVEQAVAELGYRPNGVARALRRGPDDALTLIVPQSADTDLTLAADRLLRYARQLGYRVVEDAADRGGPSTRLLVITG